MTGSYSVALLGEPTDIGGENAKKRIFRGAYTDNASYNRALVYR